MASRTLQGKCCTEVLEQVGSVALCTEAVIEDECSSMHMLTSRRLVVAYLCHGYHRVCVCVCSASYRIMLLQARRCARNVTLSISLLTTEGSRYVEAISLREDVDTMREYVALTGWYRTDSVDFIFVAMLHVDVQVV